MKRRIFRTGNSLAISIPRESVRDRGLQGDSEVHLSVDEVNGRIIIEPGRPSPADIDSAVPGS